MHCHVRVRVCRVRERLPQTFVDLHDVHVPSAPREVLGQHSEATSDLEHNVARRELGRAADNPEDVGVDQEVLAEVAVGTDAESTHPPQAGLNRPFSHGAHPQANTRAALRCTVAPSSSDAHTALLGEEGRGVHDERGLVALLTDRLWTEIRGVRLHQQTLLGNPPRRSGQVGCARVGDVACEGDRVAAPQALLQPLGHREAVHHHAHPVGFRGELLERPLRRRARVDHERLTRLARQLDLRRERTLLVGARSAVAIEVQPCLADRNTARVRSQGAQLGQIGVVEALGRVRMPADRRVHLGEVLGRRQRRAA